MYKSLLLVVSVGVCFATLGCNSNTHSTSSDEHDQPGVASKGADPHSHAEPGPHGGDLIVLGEEAYHAELLHDEANHSVTVYLQDTDGQALTGVDEAKVQLQVFQDGDFINYALAPGAEPNMFTLVDETLCDMLLHSADVKGRLNVTIDGKDYVGMIAHEPHEHEGHVHQ